MTIVIVLSIEAPGPVATTKPPKEVTLSPPPENATVSNPAASLLGTPAIAGIAAAGMMGLLAILLIIIVITLVAKKGRITSESPQQLSAVGQPTNEAKPEIMMFQNGAYLTQSLRGHDTVMIGHHEDSLSHSPHARSHYENLSPPPHARGFDNEVPVISTQAYENPLPHAALSPLSQQAT